MLLDVARLLYSYLRYFARARGYVSMESIDLLIVRSLQSPSFRAQLLAMPQENPVAADNWNAEARLRFLPVAAKGRGNAT